MNPDRWKQVSRIYGAVLTKPQAARAAALAELCADDVDLRRDVESLLREEESNLLDRPAVERPSVMAMASGLAVGSQIGIFRIDSLLGVGGMGEVYRARDTKLNRDVAIKILPPAFAGDPDRLARFKREAQVLAALNHPHIAGIHGFEDSGAIHALVLELVDGPTLADRIARGALPLDEALAIARQCADALEAAHEQGIVHRDLKPANIKVREDGTVKVLDFGLAKFAEAGGAGTAGQAGRAGVEGLTQSPTITTPAMTAAGMILGTAAYMSPEQAKGKPADRRSDIWAFGCVLFEMLTGKRPFDGEDVSDTLAAILRAEPNWAALPASTPASIQRLLRRCLLKDKKQRIGDVATLRLEIDEAPLEPPKSPVAPPRRRPLMPVAAAAVMAGLLGAAATMWLARDQTTEPQELRVDIATPDSREPSSIALSPDGSKIAYVVDSSGRSQLWLRDLATGVARAIDGTAGGVVPFWSPNSRSLAFFADGWLKRIDIAGGPARDVAPAPGGRGGGSWGSLGTILYTPSGASGLSIVSENGGAVRVLTQYKTPEEQGHRGAVFLPDGKHFLFFTVGTAAVRGVYVGAVDGTPPRRLVESDASAVYIRGHIVFLRGNTMFAQGFDPQRLMVSGDVFQVAEAVNANPGGLAAISATAHTLAFRRGALGDRRQLVWVDRSNGRREALGEPDVGTRLSSPDLSSSGRRVAIGRMVNDARDIWTMELGRSTWTRVSTVGAASQAVWSPDDQQLAIISSHTGKVDIYLRPATPGGVEQLLYSSPDLKGVTDWSADGRYLVFNVTSAQSSDIWAYSFADKRAFAVVKQSGASQFDAQLSPNGKWLGYQSNQSGRFEIYVQPFLSPENAVQVSTTGGAQVRWRKDGRELYYVDLDERLVAVPMTPASDGKSIEPGQPQRLFQVRLPGGTLQPGGSHQQYAVSDDGQKFLVNTLLPEPAPTPITLILNWKGRP